MSQSIDIKYVDKFTGYKNYRDVTNLAVTDITAGSQNIFIEDGVKLACRGGSDYFGAPGSVGVNTDASWTLANRIHSDYDKFVNNQGTTMPFRIFYSGTTAQGDVLETWLPTFLAGVPQATKQWYQVTPTAPAIPINSVHKWYWAEWFDTLNTQNRVVFTYGANRVGSYTGGYAPVTATTATTIVTNGTWESKGFIVAPEGVNSVVIGGVTYAITSGNFSTNTITVASTAGININDVAFQSLNSDVVGFGTADFCSSLNNQVYYEDWLQRNIYISWNRNRPASLGDTFYIGTSGLDDAVFGGTFTGTSNDTFLVNIDSVDPDIDTQTFFPGGNGNLNDAQYDVSGYSGSIGVTNNYRTMIVADTTIVILTGATGFTVGSPIRGVTSGAEGVVIYRVNSVSTPAADFLAVLLRTPGVNFEAGETMQDLTSSPFNTTNVQITTSNDWIQYTKNGIIVNTTTGLQGPQPISFLVPATPTITLSDGLDISFTNFNNHAVGDSWELEKRIGNDNTFSWSKNGTTQGNLITITGSAQALSDGVTVDFVEEKGHNVGDSWRVIAYKLVQKGWRDFYYSQPVRLPGEGFELPIDSNGFTMSPQESSMYIVSESGQYYTVQPQLSSDLQSETFIADRLKTEQQNRPLFPYLMTPTKNNISVVSLEKTWDILGRQKFLELPQTKTLSDYVKVDFDRVDWEDANIRYIGRKTYFAVPRSGYVFVYDEFTKYWHSPMVFARRISSIAFIDGKVIGHSYERNESYELFTADTNDLGSYPLDTRIITPYFDFGKRFVPKATTAIAMDGYMDGNPQVLWKMNAGVGGCDGVRNEEVKPLFCLPIDTASLGKSSLGFHGLGNSPTNIIPHFTYGRTFNDLSYYLRNIEITCNQPDQRWSITSYGTNVDMNKLSNTTMFNKD